MQDSGKTNGEGVGDAAAQVGGGAGEAAEGTGDVAQTMKAVGGLPVGQFCLGLAPDDFGGVEFESVGEKVDQVAAGLAPKEGGQERPRWILAFSSRTKMGPRRWRSR